MRWRTRSTGGVITSLYIGTSPHFPCCWREQETSAVLRQGLLPSSKSGSSVLDAGTNRRSYPSILLPHPRCGLPCLLTCWLADRRSPAGPGEQIPVIRNQESGDDILAMQLL